jgi:hypothetical protein
MTPGGKMARPTKYSKVRGDKIARLIKGGNYASQAAAAAGISEATFYRWISKGKEVGKEYQEFFEAEQLWLEMTEEEQEAHPELKPLESEAPPEEERGFFEFCEAVKKAEAEAEAAAVVQIKAAASSGTWQAAAWFLERKFKDRWARTDKVEGTVNHTIGIGASEEELEAARARLEAARALPKPTEVPNLTESAEELIEAEVVSEEEDTNNPF